MDISMQRVIIIEDYVKIAFQPSVNLWQNQIMFIIKSLKRYANWPRREKNINRDEILEIERCYCEIRKSRSQFIIAKSDNLIGIGP